MSELEKAQAEYEKVCERLDNLNDKAFELEQEMMYLRAEEKNPSNYTNLREKK